MCQLWLFIVLKLYPLFNIYFFILFFLVICQSSVFADTIIFIDGRIVKGTIVNEEDHDIEVELKYGRVSFDRRDIARIERDKKNQKRDKKKILGVIKEKYTAPEVNLSDPIKPGIASKKEKNSLPLPKKKVNEIKKKRKTPALPEKKTAVSGKRKKPGSKKLFSLLRKIERIKLKPFENEPNHKINQNKKAAYKVLSTSGRTNYLTDKPDSNDGIKKLWLKKKEIKTLNSGKEKKKLVWSRLYWNNKTRKWASRDQVLRYK
jgi:hypothetical protein